MLLCCYCLCSGQQSAPGLCFDAALNLRRCCRFPPPLSGQRLLSRPASAHGLPPPSRNSVPKKNVQKFRGRSGSGGGGQLSSSKQNETKNKKGKSNGTRVVTTPPAELKQHKKEDLSVATRYSTRSLVPVHLERKRKRKLQADTGKLHGGSGVYYCAESSVEYALSQMKNPVY